MKIKIIKRDKIEKELLVLARKLDSNQPIKKYINNQVVFESLTAVRKILTDKRLDVWRAIRDNKPESITQLADLLKRDFRSVHRDVSLLKDLGLIKLTEGPGRRGNVQGLVSLYDELLLAVA